MLLSIRITFRCKHPWWLAWDSDLRVDAIECVLRSVYLVIGIFTAVIMNVSAGASNVKSSTSSAKKTPTDLADLIVSVYFINHHLSVLFINAFWYMAFRYFKHFKLLQLANTLPWYRSICHLNISITNPFQCMNWALSDIIVFTAWCSGTHYATEFIEMRVCPVPKVILWCIVVTYANAFYV